MTLSHDLDSGTLVRPFLIPGSTPLGPEEHRRAAIARTVSWTLVALLHVVMFFAFVIAFTPVKDRVRPLLETILMLTPPGTSARPVDIVNPDVPVDAPERLLSAPITIPKPILPEIIIDNGAPAAPGDILGAVGRTLSCGAGSWEHLTQNERYRCGYMQPWAARKLPNGNLVMVPSSQMPRLREPPPDTGFTLNSGTDRIQRDQQLGLIPGNNGCPIMQNTPCVHVTPGMRAMNGDN